MIRRSLVLYVLVLAAALFWGRVEASAVPLTVGAAAARSAASTTGYVTNAASAFVGAAFNNGMTTSVGGRLVTVPATWRLASNAAQVALTAVRTTPLGAAASIAASLLVAYGIQKCADGTWCTKPATSTDPSVNQPFLASSPHWRYVYGSVVIADASRSVVCERYRVLRGWSTVAPFGTATEDGGCQGPSQSEYIYTTRVPSGCEAGYTLASGTCYPPGWKDPTPQPATDADWAKVPPTALTSSDALLNALGKDGVFLDINPQFDAKPQVVPLSNPYADPVTGKRYQDVATVQPAPDGRTAEVQVAKQEVDSQGNPVTDASGVAAAPQKQDDPCVGHEDRLGCMTTGEVPQGPDLGKDERHITITPDTGWGADTAACPADIVVPMHLRGAQSLSFSYQPVCKAADMFRPAILGVAWIVAVLIALGMGFKGGSD